MPDGYVTEEYSSQIGNKRVHTGGMENPSKRTYEGGRPLLKVLVPNFFAGDIIGKKGAKRVELENRYNCKIRFSPNQLFYPGTDQRIVTFSGNLDDIKSIHNYVIDKLNTDAINDRKNVDSDYNKAKQIVKIICPNSCAGLIIGSGGADIKALQEQTNAKVVIGRREESHVPNERVVKISGVLEHRIDAANRVADIIAAHPENITLGNNLNYSNEYGTEEMNYGMGNGAGNFSDNFSGNMDNRFNNKQQQGGGGYNNSGRSYSGGSHGGGFGGYVQNMPNFGGNFPNNSVSQIETSVTIKMKIPEVLVSPLLGHECKTLGEVIEFSGAQIQLSPRNQYSPRILTIDGDVNQTQTAKFLINQKIQKAIDAMNQTY